MKTFLSINLKMPFAKTKLTPLLFYGVEVFGNSDATSQHKLLVAFNNVARYIFNRNGKDRISDAFFYMFDMPHINNFKSTVAQSNNNLRAKISF